MKWPAILGWGHKKDKAAVSKVVTEPTPEPVVELNEATKAMWVAVYTGAINVYEPDPLYERDDLEPFADREYANRIVRAARNLADAAVEEYEDRWGL